MSQVRIAHSKLEWVDAIEASFTKESSIDQSHRDLRRQIVITEYDFDRLVETASQLYLELVERRH